MKADLDGKEIVDEDPLLYFLASIKADKIVKSEGNIISKTSFILGEVALTPGEELLLLELGRSTPINDSELKNIRNELVTEINKLNITIKYQSMYGKEDVEFIAEPPCVRLVVASTESARGTKNGNKIYSII